jgi:hypothetical protein
MSDAEGRIFAPERLVCVPPTVLSSYSGRCRLQITVASADERNVRNQDHALRVQILVLKPEIRMLPALTMVWSQSE